MLVYTHQLHSIYKPSSETNCWPSPTATGKPCENTLYTAILLHLVLSGGPLITQGLQTKGRMPDHSSAWAAWRWPKPGASSPLPPLSSTSASARGQAAREAPAATLAATAAA